MSSDVGRYGAGTLPFGSSGAALQCVAALIVLLAGGVVLAQPAAPGPTVRTSRVTGLASFVTGGGGPIPVQSKAGVAGPADFLNQYGPLFGVTDPDRQLAVSHVRQDHIGHTHTTYRQIHEGVAVFSGVLKVHQEGVGRFVAANGDVYPIPDKLVTQPTLSVEQAVAIARAALDLPDTAIEKSELVIVDPGWYGDRPIGARLAYDIVLNGSPQAVREGFFIDAHSGDVLDRWNMIHTARDRRIYNGNGGGALPGTLARSEGDPPIGYAPVDETYDFVGDTYDYFWRAHGRDSLDDAGMPILATVNSTAPQCPNAYWDGTQIVFCNGLATDDVIGHELAHGVTQFTADLIYQNQSGQLNESFSDVFGELVDLFNGDAAWPGTPGGSPAWPATPTGPGVDTPNNARTACSYSPGHGNGVRWLIGEEIHAFPLNGALRDMWNPTCEGDPDRSYSPLQTCNPNDEGGVHSGSGIPNHAFAMLTDGKSFNGQTVTGIGPIKSGAVWYRALATYMTVASDFEDAYYAFNQAAQDLIGTYPNDPRTGLPSGDVFTAFDAEQVDKALIAVEMNGEGACGATAAILDSTPPQQCYPKATIFFDDFEQSNTGWMVANTNPPTPYDWVLTDVDLPWGWTGTVWFCDDPSIGDCAGQDESAVHTLISPAINMPTTLFDPTLAFTHYLATEPGWDGGNVSLRVNDGIWQLIPTSAFTYNPYNTSLHDYWNGNTNTNPLAGQPAWTGAGGQWGTSLVDLSGFVSGGDTVQIRFDFGKDGCTGIDGWYVDDVEVYICPPTPIGTITGAVRNTYGTPVNGATVETSTGEYATTTDGDGQYTLLAVAEGTYDVTASTPGYLAQTHSSVQVVGDQTTTLDFGLGPLPADATIAGQVIDTGGVPIPDAVVHTDAGCHWARTDGDGLYTLSGVAAGVYHVTALKKNYEPQSQSDVGVGSGQMVSVDFSLPDALPFAGVVNGDFEGGSYSDPDGEHRVANGWSKFVMSGNPKHTVVWDSAHHSGLYAQTFYESNWMAGVYQRVYGTIVGGSYTASAWVRASDNSVLFWIGVHPSGGTSPSSPDVIWGPATAPGTTWTRIAETFDADGTTATFFIRAQYPWGGNENAYIDDADVTQDFIPDTTIDRSPSLLSPWAQQGVDADDQTFTVANAGDGVLHYTLCSDAPWMWVEPDRGDSADLTDVDTITVHYATSTMLAGTYEGTIRVTDPFATNTPSEIAVTLTVGGTPTVGADFDRDGDVDQEDFGHLQACLTGPVRFVTDPSCQNADLDNNVHVDIEDFGIFQACFSGPNIPINPNCAN